MFDGQETLPTSEAENTGARQAATQFHELLLSIRPLLLRQAMALTRHRADAEDLVQSAVTSALAAEESFSIGTNFRAWMTLILRNHFFSSVRRRRILVDLDDIPSLQLGRSGGQEETVEVEDLDQHMLRLPANQRQILLMISVQGLSYDEASRMLGVAPGTLKCRVFRARSQLQIWMFGEEVSPRTGNAPDRIEPASRTSPDRQRARRGDPEAATP